MLCMLLAVGCCCCELNVFERIDQRRLDINLSKFDVPALAPLLPRERGIVLNSAKYYIKFYVK